MSGPTTGMLGKKFPTPIHRTMWPFYAAGLTIAYGINSLSGFLANTDEYKNDPRNPALRSGGSKAH